MPNGQVKARPLKSLIAIGLSIGLGIGIGIVAAGHIYQWYMDRPLPSKNWKTLKDESAGLQASLKTEWRNGVLYYQFRVSPLDLTDAFDKFARWDRLPEVLFLSPFQVHFQNSSGFELCKIELPSAEIEWERNSKGLTEALSQRGSLSSLLTCSSDDHRHAQEWTLTNPDFLKGLAELRSREKQKLYQSMPKD